MKLEAKAADDSLIVEFIKWWEKKRLLYNLIIGALGIIILILTPGRYLLISYPKWTIIHIILYGIVANVCFTFGWIWEIVLLVYFKRKSVLGKFKAELFWIGTACSVLITAWLAFVIPFFMSIDFD